MSIEIFYGRNFVKIDENRVIPLYLSGSSNCTEFVGGKEVYERRWGYHPFNFFTTLNEINEVLDKFDDPYGEWFARGSRSGPWMSKEQFRTICKNAFKDAHTVEEFAASYQPIHLVAWKYGDTWERKMDTVVRTTEELLGWYEQFNSTLANDGFHISISLSTREQVKFIDKTAKKFPCVLKANGKYLCKDVSYDNKYATWCADKKEAKIFNSQSEIDETMPRVVGLWNRPYAFVSATVSEKSKPFAIVVLHGSKVGLYIKKKTSAHIFFSYNGLNARRFSTEKEAEKYMNTIHCDAISEMKVVRVN